MKKRPTPVAFHGIAVRVRDPRAAARRIRGVLGWRVLFETSREIVLGDGPELFLSLRRAGGNTRSGVEEMHLAVEKLALSRRKSRADALGGDSWTVDIADGVSLVVRELRRAPGKRWRKARRPIR